MTSTSLTVALATVAALTLTTAPAAEAKSGPFIRPFGVGVTTL